jgi:hypothetical protein
VVFIKDGMKTGRGRRAMKGLLHLSMPVRSQVSGKPYSSNLRLQDLMPRERKPAMRFLKRWC